MDTLIKDGYKDDRNTQETPVKLDSKINPDREEEERRYTQHHKSPYYGDACEHCGFRHNCEGKHYHRGHHRSHRWRRFIKTATPLLIVLGICFFVALVLTYMTGSLPHLMERIVSKNIEKAIQRTTTEFSEGKFSPEALKGLGKNIDIEKLKGQALKNLGGWGGDRGEEQSPDEYKDQEDYLKHIPRDDLEKKKDYYKEMLRK